MRPRPTSLTLLVAVLAASAAARADSPSPDGDPGGRRPPPADRDHRASLRMGGATTDSTGRPTICLEVRAVSRLSFETCGTGAGVLTEASGQEMAHFRAVWQLWGTDLGPARMRLRGGAGFAELQLGEDDPGFQFGSPRDPARASAAGPEATLSAQWLVGVAAGVEMVATGTIGAGWFAGAPELYDPRDRLQPFASIDLGIGF